MNEKTKEITYALLKGGLGSIPLAGGAVSEVFGVIFSDPATKRRERAMSEIIEKLSLLEDEGYQVEQLIENEEFVSVVIKAYNIAMQTHEEDKLKALMNAVYNTPKSSVHESEKIMFLNYVSEFTEWHLKILYFCNNPERFYEEHGNRPNYENSPHISTLLVDAYPELKHRFPFYTQVVRDLYNRGLFKYQNIETHFDKASDAYKPMTTVYGNEFVLFVLK
ncbi:hypothetical protein [Priestia megaterium]|uniref:hypothetical protein n=1 Tax=Priestia megaterium TaxID=1404 RepID=UPI000D50ABA2|nr:hypothetical protein [Priestia megaterium]PVE74442.1 hypothetical protein DC428_00605 [Priestia megaterium]PVE82377.1 hypothetical protein DC421_19795 [Priestia megaterium]PVE86963.1 hypothetical protein DC426_16800 [Priestia megaterium]PVE94442.1 hypothetical protein DC433_24910 [Priestia megaterium]